MIEYVEAGIRFTNAYGDINDSFYTSITSMLEKALEHISANKIKDVFKERIVKMITDTEHIG